MTPIFDAAIHPTALNDQDLRDLAWFGVRGAVAVAGHDVPGADAGELIEWLGGLVRSEPQRLRRAGVAPFVALGIHPRQIPQRGFEEVLAALPPLFDEARVVAVGSIGLDRGGPIEEEALGRQLELAQNLGARVLIYTPERDKLRITRRVLAILRESGIEPQRVLIGQTTPQTIRLVRACGFASSLSVHPTRLRAEEAVRLVGQVGSGDLLLASEAGAGPGDLLALPRAVYLMDRAGLSPEIVRRVSRDNALAFFGIDPEALR